MTTTNLLAPLALVVFADYTDGQRSMFQHVPAQYCSQQDMASNYGVIPLTDCMALCRRRNCHVIQYDCNHMCLLLDDCTAERSSCGSNLYANREMSAFGQQDAAPSPPYNAYAPQPSLPVPVAPPAYAYPAGTFYTTTFSPYAVYTTAFPSYPPYPAPLPAYLAPTASADAVHLRKPTHFARRRHSRATVAAVEPARAVPPGAADDRWNFDRTTSPVATHHECGCSWNERAGCVMSAPQMVNELSDEDMIADRWCGEHIRTDAAAAEDCNFRREVFAKIQSFRKCIGMTARDCAEAEECQWGSQGSGQCGLDEEKLLLRLVGPQQQKHPLVQAVMLHDHCSKHSEEWCEADSSCFWRHMAGRGSCDVHIHVLTSLIVTHPEMVLGLLLVSSEGLCKGLDKEKCMAAGDVSQKGCYWDGACQVRLEAPEDTVTAMLDSLCRQSPASACNEPCRLAKGTCTASAAIQWRNFTNFEENVRHNRVTRVVALLTDSSSSTQLRCEQLQPEECKPAPSTCSGLTFAVEPRGVRQVGPGVKGLIRTAASAIAEGKTAEFLDNYLQNNPEKVKDLTDKAFAGLSSLLLKPTESAAASSSSAGRGQSSPAPAPLSMERSPHTLPKHALKGRQQPGPAETTDSPLVQYGEVEEKQREELTEDVFRHGTLMMVAVGAAAIIAAVCAAFCFGAMCQAHMGHAREPLLLGGGGQAQETQMSSVNG